MQVVFSIPAAMELEAATRFYELEHPGLGQRFRREVGAAARRIGRYPLAWSLEGDDVRRCLLQRFPYKLLYAVEADQVVILAVAHQHRRPDYWLDR